MAYNLEITQGTDYTRTFIVQDINKNVLPLTGYTLVAQIRRNHTSTEYFSFTMTIISAPLGKVSMFLPHSITSILDGKYMYDIFLVDSSNIRHKLEDGLVTILPNITKIP